MLRSLVGSEMCIRDRSVSVSEKSQFVGNEMRMQTCRRTELLQMLGVTTIGSHSHVGSQTLGEDRHLLVHVFSWHLFPSGRQSDFQLMGCLMLRLEFTTLFQHGAQDVTASGFKSGELEGHSVFLMNPFTFSQFCMTLAH